MIDYENGRIIVTTVKEYDPIDCYMEHVAPGDAQMDIDEIWERLNRFLKLVDADMDLRSEWSYSCQHRGISATPKYGPWDEEEPYYVDESHCGWWCDYDLMEAWNAHYDKLAMLYKAYHRTDHKIARLCTDYSSWDDAPYGIQLRWDRLIARREAIENAYMREYELALENVCNTAERMLYESCDYRYSRECAEEWLEDNEWRL